MGENDFSYDRRGSTIAYVSIVHPAPDAASLAHRGLATLRLDPKDSSTAHQLALCSTRQGNTWRADERFAQVRKTRSKDFDQAGANALVRIVREGSK